MRSELKPCPLCGAEAYWVSPMAVYCGSAHGCLLSGSDFEITAAIWNALHRRSDAVAEVSLVPAKVIVEFDDTVGLGGEHHIKCVHLSNSTIGGGVFACVKLIGAPDAQECEGCDDRDDALREARMALGDDDGPFICDCIRAIKTRAEKAEDLAESREKMLGRAHREMSELREKLGEAERERDRAQDIVDSWVGKYYTSQRIGRRLRRALKSTVVRWRALKEGERDCAECERCANRKAALEHVTTLADGYMTQVAELREQLGKAEREQRELQSRFDACTKLRNIAESERVAYREMLDECSEALGTAPIPHTGQAALIRKLREKLGKAERERGLAIDRAETSYNGMMSQHEYTRHWHRMAKRYLHACKRMHRAWRTEWQEYDALATDYYELLQSSRDCDECERYDTPNAEKIEREHADRVEAINERMTAPTEAAEHLRMAREHVEGFRGSHHGRDCEGYALQFMRSICDYLEAMAKETK